MAKFFEPFPTITYNGVACKNIVKRTALSNDVRREYRSFYNFELQDGDRPDIVAHQAYNDQYFDWVVYYTNRIVDPYHGWCLSQSEFNDYIADKYGSTTNAREQISHYRVTHDDQTLTVAGYNALLPSRKKYWTAVCDEYNNALYYTRIKMELKVNTNSVVRLTGTLTNTTTADFAVGEHVTQAVNGILVASGDVARTTATTIELVNIQGTFVVGQVVGLTTDTEASIGGVEILGVTIPPDELVYWEPVSFFDAEVEHNEMKRQIQMLVPGIASRVVLDHKDLVNE